MVTLLLLALAAGAGSAAAPPADTAATRPGVSASADTPWVASTRRFADELFAQGDWFRAATEYLRVASLDPAAPDAGEMTFRASLAAYRAGQWTEARRRLLALAETSATGLADRSRYLAAAASFRLGEYETARSLSATVRRGDPALADRAALLEGLSALHTERWTVAGAAFAAVPAASPLAGSARSLTGIADRGDRLSRGSPWVGAGLSALVPGLGQIASGYVWDGLSALLLAGGSAALLAAGLDRDNGTLIGFGIGGLAVFYPANVYGGANAPGRRFRESRRVLLEEADRTSTLSLE